VPVDPRFLRECLRRRDEFRHVVASSGNDIINGEGDFEGQSICFWDLFLGWSSLTHKQRQAVFLLVLCDYSEADAALMLGFPRNRRTYISDRVSSALRRMAEFH
jgi:hypothetical protein